VGSTSSVVKVVSSTSELSEVVDDEISVELSGVQVSLMVPVKENKRSNVSPNARSPGIQIFTNGGYNIIVHR
jgi:hypothetical protein